MLKNLFRLTLLFIASSAFADVQLLTGDANNNVFFAEGSIMDINGEGFFPGKAVAGSITLQ